MPERFGNSPQIGNDLKCLQKCDRGLAEKVGLAKEFGF